MNCHCSEFEETTGCRGCKHGTSSLGAHSTPWHAHDTYTDRAICLDAAPIDRNWIYTLETL